MGIVICIVLLALILSGCGARSSVVGDCKEAKLTVTKSDAMDSYKYTCTEK